MSAPEPPEGVRLRYLDGTCSEPLPLILIGHETMEGRLVAVWEACAPDDREFNGVLIARLPASATIQIALP